VKRKLVISIVLVALVALVTAMGPRPIKRWQFNGCCNERATEIEVQTVGLYMDGPNLVEGWAMHPESPFALDGIYEHRGWTSNPRNANRWRFRCSWPDITETPEWFSYDESIDFHAGETCPE
jgi:hypothetical protein